jgi:cytochrome c-type biogenesis protein CcmH
MESGNQTPKAATFALGGAVAILIATLAYGAIRQGPAPKAEPTPSGAAMTVEALEEAARASPGDARAWSALGEAYFVREEYSRAAAAYERATAVDAKGAGYWSALGEARVMASAQDPMPPAALDAFRKAAAIDARDPRARYFLAVKKDLDGDHKGAVDDWLALLGDTPPGAPWEQDLRRTIVQVGKINNIEVETRIAKIRPKSQLPADFAARGIPGPNAEQIDAAKAMTPGQQAEMVRGMVSRLEAKLEADPTNLQGWVMLMRSRVTLGEQAKAAAALKAAVAANPGARAELEAQAKGLGIAVQ